MERDCNRQTKTKGNTKMKPIQCHHCKYEWNYKGSAIYECACPKCRYRVQINWTEAELEILKEIKELEKGIAGDGVEYNNTGEDA